MIEDDSKKANDIIGKLNEIRHAEVINNYGVMTGSVLTVSVIEARDLRTQRGIGACNTYVLLSLGEE